MYVCIALYMYVFLPFLVKKCNWRFYISDVIAGLDASVEHWLSLSSRPSERPPAVLTLSLGVPAGLASRTLEDAVTNLIRRFGFTVVVAAGNARGSNRQRDACQFSPGRVPSVITVGATGRSDRTWPDGMTGPCVVGRCRLRTARLPSQLKVPCRFKTRNISPFK